MVTVLRWFVLMYRIYGYDRSASDLHWAYHRNYEQRMMTLVTLVYQCVLVLTRSASKECDDMV